MYLVPVGKKFVTEPLATIPNSRAMRTYVLMSIKASLKPCQNDCPSLLTQSSIPISSWSLHTASWRSSSESHLVVRGKLGRMKKLIKAMVMVMAPSMMTMASQYTSHLTLLIPRLTKPAPCRETKASRQAIENSGGNEA